MAGKGFEDGGKDQLDELESRIEDLESKVTRLSNVKQPTMPLYPSISTPNPGDVPNDPLEGQLALGVDDNDLWRYINGQWRPLASSALPPIRYLFVRANQNVPNNTRTQINFNSMFWSTNDIGGTPSTGGTSFEGDNFKIDKVADVNSLVIKSAGVYYVETAPIVNTTSLSPGSYIVTVEPVGLVHSFGPPQTFENFSKDDLNHFNYTSYVPAAPISATWYATQASGTNWTSQPGIDVYVLKIR